MKQKFQLDHYLQALKDQYPDTLLDFFTTKVDRLQYFLNIKSIHINYVENMIYYLMECAVIQTVRGDNIN